MRRQLILVTFIGFGFLLSYMAEDSGNDTFFSYCAGLGMTLSRVK